MCKHRMYPEQLFGGICQLVLASYVAAQNLSGSNDFAWQISTVLFKQAKCLESRWPAVVTIQALVCLAGYYLKDPRQLPAHRRRDDAGRRRLGRVVLPLGHARVRRLNLNALNIFTY